jgi:phage shock protein B
MANTLSPEDEKQFEELWRIAERMDERMANLERILDAETPEREKQG